MQIRIIPRSYVQLETYIRSMNSRINGIDEALLPFAPQSIQKYKTESLVFLERLNDYYRQMALQIAASAKAREALAELRMFVSHFFQSLNNAIARKMIMAADRILFGVDANDSTVPKLTTEAEVLSLADWIKRGEAKRSELGGVAVAFPSAAEVEVVADKWGEAMRLHSDALLAAGDKRRAVKKAFVPMRDAIMDLYDELEFAKRKNKPGYIRNLLRGYGMQYRTVTTYAFKKTIPLAAGETLTISEFALTKTHRISIKLKTKGKGSVLICREAGGCTPENALVLKKGKALQLTLKELPGKGDFLVMMNGGVEGVVVDVKVLD